MGLPRLLCLTGFNVNNHIGRRATHFDAGFRHVSSIGGRKAGFGFVSLSLTFLAQIYGACTDVHALASGVNKVLQNVKNLGGTET